ncbi:AAA family ATPase [uncultured Capnocytophaga sp.]|uniref:AAA family ATPase n=1 Tax=uncultured Capnocytophaga sp. TaxID=159273 RepID=UPI002634DD5C|nr:AAA family ATPase [uncultured Capnocytophaga sp.]
MYEKINELIEYYITLRREDPANENEVYKWYAIAHFQQYWDINATDFYEMFKEAFREKNNLVDYRPFGILEALGENYPTKLKELLGIVYGADDFYTKLGKCRTFTENVIDDLKEKSNTNFSSKIDERTLSFLLTLKFPNEHTFYKRNIYTRLCEYLGEVSRKECKYEHFIELLTKITTYFNNPELKQLTSNFIPKGFDEPLLLAQDIVYQNINKENEDPKRYWLYSPGEQAVKWEEFYNESIMAIGWDKLGDLENYTDRKSILEALINNYGGGEDQRNNVSAIDDFCNGENKINKGDIVIAKKGTKTLLGYGKVISDYYFDEERATYKHYRKVKWLKKGVWDANNNLPTKTLTDVTTYNSDIEGIKYAQYLLNIMNENTNKQENNHMIELLKYKPQIILQGPPGTGKTREAKRIAKALLGLGENDSLESNEQFKFIQFHPSYSYEDFVRGIVAKPNEDGDGIIYTAENKVLAEFAKEALNNWHKAQQSTQTLKEQDIFEAFIEHIKEELAQSEDYKYPLTEAIYIFNADDKRFKYKGDNWEVHSKGINMNYAEIKRIIDSGVRDRQGVTKLTNIGGQARQHASYFIRIVEKYYEFKKTYKPNVTDKISLKNYVLIIDEINRANLSAVLGELIYALEYRGEAVQSMYAIDGENNLILPPNLYIIGTMNTADRSVGHIDYAIRRRFAFVNVLPKDLTDELGDQFESELFAKVTNLFNTNLSPEFKKEDVQLGHSYFITKNIPINIRWEYEIKPILLEYVKDGILIGEGIETTINNLINNENNAS